VYENRIMKPVKNGLKGRRMGKSHRGGKFDQSMSYACMEISQ
jgi:hypothetical protein